MPMLSGTPLHAQAEYMTSIRFITHAVDRLQTAAAFAVLSHAQGQRLLVYAPLTAERFDHLLWMQPPTGFAPHCRADSPLAGQTPILIASQLADTLVDAERILLNLADETPPHFARFVELVEIVSSEDAVRLPARERFKFYRERGYPLTSIEAGKFFA